MLTSDEPKLDDGLVHCHSCDNTYERPGYHWSNGSCDYPDLPDDKGSLVLGLMLGDGTLRRHTSEPFVQTYMINEDFLEWIDDELGWLSTGVSLYRTAEHSAQLSRDNGYPEADEANYHDVYVTQTRTLPAFRRYQSWYEGNDRKVIPDRLELSPIEAKVWYCCDGSLNWDRRYPNSRPHATIGITGGTEVTDPVLRMFEESTFGHAPRVDQNNVRFSVDETEALLEWMGTAPPGFEYKWTLESLETYEERKTVALEE